MADWVVIVDDDTTTLKQMEQILSGYHKSVTTFTSGYALLDFIQGNVPDIILLDIKMPGMDGFETLKQLREYERNNGLEAVPVIFLTADDDADAESRGFQMGVSDFIRKPILHDVLAFRIDNVIGRRERLAEQKKSSKQLFDENNEHSDLHGISMLLEEKSISNEALGLEREDFLYVYRFVMRYIKRYRRNACKLLFSLAPAGEQEGPAFEGLCDRFMQHAKKILRKSDLIMQFRKDKIFVLLTDIREDAIAQVVGLIKRTWNQENGENLITVNCETEFMEADDLRHASEEQSWVAVVDDDITNLKMVGHVLSRNNMRVTALKSGKALLEFLKDNRPNLILLDVQMPDMDGFETMRRLVTMDEDIADIPVIFLTASGEEETEKTGLAIGAIDFIRKPFVPEVLVMRVNQIIEMIRLQRNLSREVERKTKQHEELFLDVVKSLADAIDAKDTYTKGHSGRVAEYSKMIAKRFGYNSKEQADIYMMGLLHDVGKIGVPDTVINKPGRLTDEEFELIKKHPVIGAQILKNIKEMPSLINGAKWHHERYDGKGYPDGLKGDEIPEVARIIAVADAYDAMTSFRSYRDVIPQDVVRAEIEKCSGTQFDPRFAKIMLKMIDEDKNFDMREKKQ